MTDRDVDWEQNMTVTVTITSDTGHRTYTGHVVCRGPSTMELLLTEPFALAGRTVHFPLADILSEESVAPLRVPVAGPHARS